MDTLNTNVGDMPLDIFADYISDTLGEEWSWEYLLFAVNGFGYDEFGYGVYSVNNDIEYCEGYGTIDGYGFGHVYGYANWSAFDLFPPSHGFGNGNSIKKEAVGNGMESETVTHLHQSDGYGNGYGIH
jgi:hypothetical protein